jgi:hypothetical protein
LNCIISIDDLPPTAKINLATATIGTQDFDFKGDENERPTKMIKNKTVAEVKDMAAKEKFAKLEIQSISF